MISRDLLNKRAEIGKMIPILKSEYMSTRDRETFLKLTKVTKEYRDLLFEVYSLENVEFALNALGDDQFIIIDDILIEKTLSFIIFKDMHNESTLKHFDKKYKKYLLTD